MKRILTAFNKIALAEFPELNLFMMGILKTFLKLE